jgi:hypothetical protein
MKYESPDQHIERPGKPTLQAWSEAEQAAEEHNRWHREHPGEPCDPGMFPMDNYEAMERGERLLGAMTFEAGDSFIGRK